MDHVKKVCKKFQGMAAGSAFWCTNVGNERGEVLVSVLTESEGMEGSCPMAIRLIERLAKTVAIYTSYLLFRCKKARQDPPLVIYTDRDCCLITGGAKAKDLGTWLHL